MPENYPKWLYHRTHEPVIVKDPDEQKALGGGWQEVPADADSEESSEAQMATYEIPLPKAKKNANR